MMDALEPWEFCWVVKCVGEWAHEASWEASLFSDEQGVLALLRSIGIPPRYEGAVLFEKHERHALALLLVSEITHGSMGYDNLWVAPDHARQLIRTEDDDITEMHFHDQASAERGVALLAARGFPLSTDPPIPGMPREPWM